MRKMLVLLLICMAGCGGIVTGNSHRAIVNQYKSELKAAEEWSDSLSDQLSECIANSKSTPAEQAEADKFAKFFKEEWTPMLAKILSEAIGGNVEIFAHKVAFLNDFRLAITNITITSDSRPMEAYATFYQDTRGWYFVNIMYDPELMNGRLLDKLPKEQKDDQKL